MDPPAEKAMSPEHGHGRKASSAGADEEWVQMTTKVYYSLLSEGEATTSTAACSYFARPQNPVWVQKLPGGRYGRVTLKTCLGALCISRPELVSSLDHDYVVLADDPQESALHPDMPPLMEGKGMLSWNLAEKKHGSTWVTGVVGPDGSLAVRLQLERRLAITQHDFIKSLKGFARTKQQQQAPSKSGGGTLVPNVPAGGATQSAVESGPAVVTQQQQQQQPVPRVRDEIQTPYHVDDSVAAENPMCENCGRQSSNHWRRSLGDRGKRIVCNTCGMYFNRYGYHRIADSASKKSRPVAPKVLGSQDDNKENIAPWWTGSQNTTISPAAGPTSKSHSHNGSHADLRRQTLRPLNMNLAATNSMSAFSSNASPHTDIQPLKRSRTATDNSSWLAQPQLSQPAPFMESGLLPSLAPFSQEPAPSGPVSEPNLNAVIDSLCSTTTSSTGAPSEWGLPASWMAPPVATSPVRGNPIMYTPADVDVMSDSVDLASLLGPPPPASNGDFSSSSFVPSIMTSPVLQTKADDELLPSSSPLRH